MFLYTCTCLCNYTPFYYRCIVYICYSVTLFNLISVFLGATNVTNMYMKVCTLHYRLCVYSNDRDISAAAVYHAF